MPVPVLPPKQVRRKATFTSIREVELFIWPDRDHARVGRPAGAGEEGEGGDQGQRKVEHHGAR